MSLCECRVEKMEGRWRITEEWLVRSHNALIAACTADPAEEARAQADVSVTWHDEE